MCFFVLRLRYMWSTISVHHYVDIGSLQENICLFYAEGLQMLNVCLVSYVKLLMCNWTSFFTTSNIDHRWPIRERINVNKHVASDVSWKGAASDCTDIDIQCTETGCTKKTCTESVCTEIVLYRKRPTPSTVLWPNGWMDEDATVYGSRHRAQATLYYRRVPSAPRKGHSTPPLIGHNNIIELNSTSWVELNRVKLGLGLTSGLG